MNNSYRAEGALTEEREMPTTAKFDVTIIYIYISDRGSSLAETREPYDLILKKLEGF